MYKRVAERIQRNEDEIQIVMSDEEEEFRKKFFSELGDAPNLEKCTVCLKHTGSQLYAHPTLGVTVCFKCYTSYQGTVFMLYKDGTDTQCRWCGELPVNYCSCAKCTCIFCRTCLERNFGEELVESTMDNITKDWSCLICQPKQLWGLRAYHVRAKNAQTSANSTE